MFDEPLQARRRKIVVTGAAMLSPRGLKSAEETVHDLNAKKDINAISPSVAPVERELLLDSEKARRFDELTTNLAVVCERAIACAGGSLAIGDAARTGATAGIALRFSGLATFFAPILARGIRFGKPAHFPNLVFSSPLSHVSIYEGLRGPVFTTADLATSAESAFLAAIEAIDSDEADAMVASAVIERSPIIAQVLGPQLMALEANSDNDDERQRAVAASAIFLETDERARDRGIQHLAHVHDWAWGSRLDDCLLAIGAPQDKTHALVVLSRRDAVLLQELSKSTWHGVQRMEMTSNFDDHEGLGGVALVVATGSIVTKNAREVLVLGRSFERWVAIRLVAPSVDRQE